MRLWPGLVFLAAPAVAEVPCENIDHLGASYTVCDVSTADDLQLFLRAESGGILGSFSAVE